MTSASYLSSRGGSRLPDESGKHDLGSYAVGTNHAHTWPHNGNIRQHSLTPAIPLAHRSCDRYAGWSSCVKQRFGLVQIRGVKALSEPTVDLRQQLSDLVALALALPAASASWPAGCGSGRGLGANRLPRQGHSDSEVGTAIGPGDDTARPPATAPPWWPLASWPHPGLAGRTHPDLGVGVPVRLRAAGGRLGHGVDSDVS